VATRWQRQLVWLTALWAGASALAATAALAAGLTTPSGLLARGGSLGALLALAFLCAGAALAPHPRLWAPLAIVATVVVMGAIALGRGAGSPSTTPEWVCSVSHLSLGTLPLLAALWASRQAAWRWWRAMTAGLGAGTVGAFLGELACHQGTRHVLVHHVGAWLTLSAACLVASRRLRPRTFAP
jgi:hypothetical protein